MSRLNDLTIRRAAVTHDSPWTEYWHTHTPDAHDLAELFKISPRRVRELWQEGYITRGGSLPRAVSEWTTYRDAIERQGRGGQKPGGGRA